MHTAIPKIAIPKDHRQHQRQVAAGGGAPTVTLTLTKVIAVFRIAVFRIAALLVYTRGVGKGG